LFIQLFEVHRATKLLNCIVNALQDEAIDENLPKLRQSDIAAIGRLKPPRFNTWLRETTTPDQIASLLSLLDFLKPEKVEEIFLKRDILTRRLLTDEPALNPKKKKNTRQQPKKKSELGEGKIIKLVGARKIN
jgi:hypothetical protein